MLDGMTATLDTRPAAVRPAATPWRLRGRTRKAVLITHILAVGTWIGVDVLVGVFVLAGWLSPDPAVRGAAYQALGTFVVWPMLAAGLASLCTLIVLLLRPGLGELAAYGREVAAGTAAERDLADLFFPPAVSLTALTIATVLSVAKPWGRTRRDS